MNGEWRASTWGEEISLEYGKALRGYDATRGKYRVFGSNGPIGWTDTSLAPGPGVILGRKGAYRGIEFSRDPFFVIDTAYYVVPKSELDMRWLYYAIKYHKLGEIDDGSPIPSTTRSAVYVRDLDVPPPAEQKAIASVLGALDDKIELHRGMNATLEAMARALFQSWFVDFDPIRAKLDGRQPTRLDPAIAALFPNEFEDSTIGRVPKGWKVERFDCHITAERGLSYSGDGLRDDGTGLPMHNLNSVYEGGGYKHGGIKYYAGEYREKHLTRPGDMIVTNTEQGFDHLLIGHAAIVPECYGPIGLYSHHIYRVQTKPNSPLSPHYLVQLFNSHRWHYWISGFSNGTTINMLPIDALEMPLLAVPPETLVQKFTALARAAHQQIETHIKQSRTLAKIRDALLPRLLNGELRTRRFKDGLE